MSSSRKAESKGSAATKKGGATSGDVVRNGHTMREWATLFAAEAQKHSVDLDDLGSFFNNAEMVSEDRVYAFLDLDRAQVAYIDGNTHYALEIVSKLVLIRQTYERIVPRAKRAVQYSKTQALNASNPRGRVSEEGETISQIVERLAKSPQHIDEPAKQLWTHMFSELDRLSLDPRAFEDAEDPRKWRMEYDFKGGRKPLSFGTFAGHVSKARMKKSG